MTDQEYVAMITELDAEVVTAQGWTRGQLQAAFKKVQNRKHWKGTIYALLVDATDEDLEMICEAVSFFTATVATTKRLPSGRVQVTAAGYWNGPAN